MAKGPPMKVFPNLTVATATDTRANWIAADPVVPKGVYCYELDTGQYRVGDGVRRWSELICPIAPGVTAGTLCAGNDLRLTDARTPLLHAASHAFDGVDPITPASIGAASTADVGALATQVQTLAQQSNTNSANALYTFTEQIVAGTNINADQTLVTIPLSPGDLQIGDVLLVGHCWETTYSNKNAKTVTIRLNGEVLDTTPIVGAHSAALLSQCFIGTGSIAKTWNNALVPFGTKTTTGATMVTSKVLNLAAPLVLTVSARLNQNALTDRMALMGMYVWRLRGVTHN